MAKTVKVILDVGTMEARLYSWLAKVEPCYHEEVYQSMQAFKKECGIEVEEDDDGENEYQGQGEVQRKQL